MASLDDGASLTYAQYEYLGMGTVVGVTLSMLAQPGNVRFPVG